MRFPVTRRVFAGALAERYLPLPGSSPDAERDLLGRARS
jgi:hypothetical protein